MFRVQRFRLVAINDAKLGTCAGLITDAAGIADFMLAQATEVARANMSRVRL